MPEHWREQVLVYQNVSPHLRIVRYVNFRNSSRSMILCLDRETWLVATSVDHNGGRGLSAMSPAVFLDLGGGREFFFELCNGYVSGADVLNQRHSFGRGIVNTLENLKAQLELSTFYPAT